jgi:ubiquinone/menaquinone biosynthesis C-methylase UbiE
MNADPLARWYRFIEFAVYGRGLERSRFQFLDRLSCSKRILMLGEGDGRALEQLLKLAPQARIDVVELSGKMIELARERNAGGLDRVRFVRANALEVQWISGEFDAVTTLYFLDCFGEKEGRELVGRVAEALAPGGLWLISDFAIPARGWRHWHARILIGIMYRFFGITTGLWVRTLPPIESMLLDAGLERMEIAERRAGLIRSELWRRRGRSID